MLCFFLHSQFLRCLVKQVEEQQIAKDFFDYVSFSESPIKINIASKSLEVFVSENFKSKHKLLDEWIQKLLAFGSTVGDGLDCKTEQEAIVISALHTKGASEVFIVVRDDTQRIEINKTFKLEDVYPTLRAITLQELKKIMLADKGYCEIMKKVVELHN